MNERIRELYTQSLETKFDYGGGEGVRPGEYYSNYRTVLNAEKFAELIVGECARCVEHINMQGGGNLGDVIKNKFGVKE